MNPFSHTGLSISDSLKSVRKSVLINETIIAVGGNINSTRDSNECGLDIQIPFALIFRYRFVKVQTA